MVLISVQTRMPVPADNDASNLEALERGILTLADINQCYNGPQKEDQKSSLSCITINAPYYLQDTGKWLVHLGKIKK